MSQTQQNPGESSSSAPPTLRFQFNPHPRSIHKIPIQTITPEPLDLIMPTKPSDSTPHTTSLNVPDPIPESPLTPICRKITRKSLFSPANVQLNRVQCTPAPSQMASDSLRVAARPNHHIKIHKTQKPPQATTASSKNPKPPKRKEAVVETRPTISSPMPLQRKLVKTSTTPQASRNRDKTVKSRLGRIFPHKD